MLKNTKERRDDMIEQFTVKWTGDNMHDIFNQIDMIAFGCDIMPKFQYYKTPNALIILLQGGLFSLVLGLNEEITIGYNVDNIFIDYKKK